MRKNIIISMFLSMLMMTSCLTAGLDDLPEFENADITGIQKVEYRYISDQISPSDGRPIVKYVDLPKSVVIDKDNSVVSVSVTVPAANPSSFPEKEREKCSLTNIAVMASISTAARISPIGNSPKLGTPGDWSKPNKYSVKAADGTKKEWTIQIVKFAK